ncbi:hypothetical protein OPT61_g4993 [Boeremia exigua]|uniref:Uncharacterized protein n=1 Tax=Boeremia exigua TaxID=749465 RepID=A0ACC2IC36_9PLEO|nr:hypothetical protein OPT61_g4993 [Boeremia exigua]
MPIIAPSMPPLIARAHSDTSATSTSSSSEQSSEIATSCSQQLSTEYAGCCVCAVRHYLNASHVVDKRDLSRFVDWKRRGLVSIATLSDYDNAIYLCAANHAAFNAERPGLVIVPTFLDFFLEQERRWQSAIQTCFYRSPVSAAMYAEHCAAQRSTVTQGLYTAYQVMDYKKKDVVEPPVEFQWHGDPGAILVKVQRFLTVGMSGTPRVPHTQDLKAIWTKLWDLRILCEEGDDAWAAMKERVAANKTLDGLRPGLSGLSHSNGKDSPDSGEPPARNAPTSAPPPGSAGMDDEQDHSAPTAFATLKRKRATFDCLEEIAKDAVHVEFTRKCIKLAPSAPNQHQEPSPTQHQQRKPVQLPPEPCCWGGPASSTEVTVQYWNAVFGHAYSTADCFATPSNTATSDHTTVRAL